MSNLNITFKGKKYSIDKSLLAGAISGLEEALSELESGAEGDLSFYIEDNEAGGQTLYITGTDYKFLLEDNEFGGQTAIIN